MDWVSIAVLGTIVLGLVNIFDSHLISKRMPSLRAFLLQVGLFVLLTGLVFSYLFPLPKEVGIWTLIVAGASAILRVASVTILLYTLKREEVSRAVPVVSIYPIFVAMMAIPLLGETLDYLHWIAIIVVVAGAVMVSVKRRPGSANWLGSTFFLLLGSSLLMAMADVASKYALADISFCNMYWISALSMAAIFLLTSLRPQVVRELGNIKQKGSTMALLAFNETLAMTGILLVFWAMESGPVSLVSTIAGSRPIFVFILALIFNSILPDFLLDRRSDRWALAVRLIATTMIAGGITIIYLA